MCAHYVMPVKTIAMYFYTKSLRKIITWKKMQQLEVILIDNYTPRETINITVGNYNICGVIVIIKQ